MTRTKSTYLALLAVLLSPMAANAVPILTTGAGSAVDDVDHFLTFDGISTGTDLTFYAEDGVSITTPDFAFTDYDPTGGAGGFSGGFFYATGGVNAPYAVVEVANATIFGIEFLLGSGYFADHPTGVTLFGFEAYVNGLLTGLGGGLLALGSIIGISDVDGFDEIRIFNSRPPNTINALALDNLAVDVTSVPEPGTLALLGIGLAGMGLARRRKI